jgi:4-amino-4-deoxy-L-arabinose transferase-like glycosyltransferase
MVRQEIWPRLLPGQPAPWVWILILWLAALTLALVGLGNVPLRDWDEGIVARVSLEISRSPLPQGLLPTYLAQPYLNKPPGLHLGIAGVIRLWRWASGNLPGSLPPEWVVRFLPALGSTLLVPLLGLVQWRLRPLRPEAAIATALITLTLLPLARHGRLAMLDGTQLTAMALIWLGMLSAGRSERGSFGAGLLAGVGGSLLLLLKAPLAPPVLAGALLLRRLDRDLPRRSWRWLLAGLLLGLLPGIGWHSWNLAMRGGAALVMWGPQGMARLLESVNGNGGGPFVPLLQVLIGGWPWLPLLPFGLVRAWRERHRREGRWTLGLGLLACLLVLPLRTQLPWYSLLLWPPFALACGPVLADLATGAGSGRLPRLLGGLWAGLGVLLLSAVALAPILPGTPLPAAGMSAVLAAGGGLLLGGWQLGWPGRLRKPGRAVLLVAAGWFLALGLLFASPLWNWELNEQPLITPALELAARNGKEPLHLLDGDEQTQRPSLHWYLDSTSAPLEAGRGPWPRYPFRLLGRSDPGPQGVEAGCRLEPPGQEGWRRWECRGRSGGR